MADPNSMEAVEHSLDVWGLLEAGNAGETGELLSTPIGNIHIKVVVMTWAVMIILALITFLLTRKMKVRNPGKGQVLMESLFTFVRGLVYDSIDPKKGAGLVCMIFTLFSFLLVSNLWGLVPSMMSPTANLNTTLGMALTMFFVFQVVGVKYKKGHYLKHYVEPYPVFLPLTIIEEVSKPITMAFRIYGNIYAGEVLISVLLFLFGSMATLCGGFIVCVIWLLFSIFVGGIQAFIFSMLTIAYTAQQIPTEEH